MVGGAMAPRLGSAPGVTRDCGGRFQRGSRVPGRGGTRYRRRTLMFFTVSNLSKPAAYVLQNY
jgi:hypothetical protein